MFKDRLIIKKLLKEEAKSKKQQKMFGMALNCKRTGDCASDEIKNMADSMSEKTLKDFAGTKHDGLPDKIEPETKNEIRKIVKEEILALLGESRNASTDIYRAGRSAQGVASASDVSFPREPIPVGRPRGYDKPYDRNPSINYDQRMVPWKAELLKVAMVRSRKCGANEKQVAETQKMLKFILDNYEDNDQQAASSGSKLVDMVVDTTCGV